jgi:thymidine kinase
VAAGLDKDYMARDFGPMGALKKLATQKIDVKAKCHVCNGNATFTYRKPGNDDLLLVGHTDVYEARCEEHWLEGMKDRIEANTQ